ncbi:MAG: hypothetical protein CMN65_03710 [Sphingomonadaceae bacterium]|nr:hypothetical protein [Sphingomonadaceae bacterium]
MLFDLSTFWLSPSMKDVCDFSAATSHPPSFGYALRALFAEDECKRLRSGFTYIAKSARVFPSPAKSVSHIHRYRLAVGVASVPEDQVLCNSLHRLFRA